MSSCYSVRTHDQSLDTILCKLMGDFDPKKSYGSSSKLQGTRFTVQYTSTFTRKKNFTDPNQDRVVSKVQQTQFFHTYNGQIP